MKFLKYIHYSLVCDLSAVFSIQVTSQGSDDVLRRLVHLLLGKRFGTI